MSEYIEREAFLADKKWCTARIAAIVTPKTASAIAAVRSGKDARSKSRMIISARMGRGES